MRSLVRCDPQSSQAPLSHNSNGEPFLPRVPNSLKEAGLNESQLEALVLKCLLYRGNALGWQIAEHLALPFRMLVDTFEQLKRQLLLVYKSSGPLGDYVY